MNRQTTQRRAAKARRAGHRQGVRARCWGLGLCLLVAACAHSTAIGLRPEYPRGQPYPQDEFVVVDSLQPTFRWEAFPRERDRAADTGGMLGQVTAVTYELQIWRTGERAYVKRGLTGPSHRIEHPLAPTTRYFWTVRARFEVHGEPRVTEWGMYDFGPWQLEIWGRPVQEFVPDVRYFRFATPAQ